MRLIDADKLIENVFKNPISYTAFCNLVKRQPTVDAVPRGAYDQVRWERDIALGQLKQLGYELGEKVDAVPVVHSEWIPKEKADTPYGLEMECAKCGFSVIVNDALYFKFCPNCGAKMDGKGGDWNDTK